jgi:NADPH:quinone reductase-like Zn-dependent oxidoreductase
MKAVIYTKYGSPDVLKVQEVMQPVPKKNEVLIKTFASSINAYDWHKLTADVFMIRLVCGLFKPKQKILGCDIAGKIVAVGQNVQKFKIGDEVYGSMADGLGEGGYAEYVCTPETTLTLKPRNTTFEQVATIPMAGITALQAVKLANIKSGQNILINGATGGVGTFVVQMVKNLDANITAVCSTKNIDFVNSLGVDEIIDYKKVNFWENGKQYDVIIDITASATVEQFRQSLKPKGICVVVGFKDISMFYTLKILLKGKPKQKNEHKKVALLFAKNANNPADFEEINTLLESGKVKPIIDTIYTLDDTAKAFWHYKKQGIRGKIVIKI